MNETTYLYIVHSDINENNIYAEFTDEQAAIEYARRNASELTYVDKVEVLLDEDGEVIDEFDSETIWVYSDEETPIDPEEDYWDILAAEYKDQEANKHTLGDTTWFESFDANELVETLEENETEVECKECFDLFPKADCVKVAFGYICPTCAKCEVADEDMFKVDFPEYEKFPSENEMISGEPDPEPIPDTSPNPDPMSETEETENDLISDPEEAIPFLVKDEEEAIAGYEAAAEVVADSNLENKEEILDTIDHIKEEEEEHIEELTDLVDTKEAVVSEAETDPVSNSEEEETPEEETSDELVEHVNEEHPAIESDQELEGTDNAVVDCKVADVVTHSEDEKPVDCKGEKKPLEKPLTETPHARYAKPEGDRKEAYNNALKYAKKDNAPYIYGYSGIDGKFFAFGQPVKVTGDIVEKEKEFRSRYKNCKVVYVAYPDKAFVEGYQKFTPEEMEEYGIDEDGNSIEGYDEYVRCTWCEDIFTKDMCGFEADFGWLCDRCQAAFTFRGERLNMTINTTQDDFKRVVTEQVSMTSAELIDKYGTDDIDLINAGREPEERVALQEEAPEYDLTEVNKLLAEIRGENKKKSIHMR